MVQDNELERLQSFVMQYKTDLDALIKTLEEYKKGIEIAEKNYRTFIKQRQMWIIRNIHLFLKELPENICLSRLDIISGDSILLRAYTTKNNYTDYDINSGWSQLQSVPDKCKGSDFDI